VLFPSIHQAAEKSPKKEQWGCFALTESDDYTASFVLQNNRQEVMLVLYPSHTLHAGPVPNYCLSQPLFQTLTQTLKIKF